ncbi:MAG TPA: uracil phosphoribosyltransferase [Thermomicrobiales bacterium]|jgi:uracil phosphoribosyltransferase|nr:uracil phosphoribosyltransferase [Thermomicrobiales bacterium]
MVPSPLTTSSEFPNLRCTSHPLIVHTLTQLIDERSDSATFRLLVRRLTTLLVYEATAGLPLRQELVRTPMEATESGRLASRIGLVPILRAGLGMVEPALDALPDAEVWHLGLYRDEATKRPVSYYNRLPARCPDDNVFILDPMLATGGSASDAIDVVRNWGAPSISFIGLIAAPEGVQRLAERHPDVPVFVAALHRQLNDDAFILPGLGDAGDRMFGTT